MYSLVILIESGLTWLYMHDNIRREASTVMFIL